MICGLEMEKLIESTPFHKRIIFSWPGKTQPNANDSENYKSKGPDAPGGGDNKASNENRRHGSYSEEMHHAVQIIFRPIRQLRLLRSIIELAKKRDRQVTHTHYIYNNFCLNPKSTNICRACREERAILHRIKIADTLLTQSMYTWFMCAEFSMERHGYNKVVEKL